MAESATRPKRVRARRGEGELLREEILDAAEQLLIETADASAVSIRAIGQIVGVTAPSIYRHFADKDELLLAACARAYDRFDSFLEGAASTASNPLLGLRMKAIAYLRFAMANPGQYRVLFMTPGTHVHEDFANEHAFDPDLTSIKGLQHLCESLEQAVADGYVDRVREPMQMAVMLWAAVHGLASLRIAHPELKWDDVDTQADAFFTMVTTGVLTEKGRALLGC